MKKKYKKRIDNIAGFLLLIGALAWFPVGFFDFNVVALLGDFAKYIYSLVGLSAIYVLVRILMGRFMKK